MQRVRTACVVAVGVRHLKVRQENFFRNEAISHARRGSWAPQTTAKKQGAFVRFARSIQRFARMLRDSLHVHLTAASWDNLLVGLQ